MQALYRRDNDVLVWWATEIECVSALARLERRGELGHAAAQRAFGRLDALKASWNEVQPVPAVKNRARRLLRVHDLRAADALQLAAALVGAEDHPDSLRFVSFDERLTGAAEREGLVLVDVN